MDELCGCALCWRLGVLKVSCAVHEHIAQPNQIIDCWQGAVRECEQAANNWLTSGHVSWHERSRGDKSKFVTAHCVLARKPTRNTKSVKPTSTRMTTRHRWQILQGAMGAYCCCIEPSQCREQSQSGVMGQFVMSRLNPVDIFFHWDLIDYY